MRILFSFILLLIFTSTFAQSITPDVLKSIQAKYEDSGPNQAIINALSQNDLRDICLNQNNQEKPDYYFSHRVTSKGITDQKSSGRCWLFASLNIFRPQVIEKYNLSNFEFSENYLFFYDQLEKANLFLQEIIETADKTLEDRHVEWLLKHSIGDGGVWGGFVNLVDKYGLVPSEVMPETNSSNSTRYMSKTLTTLLRQDALKLREAFNKKKKTEDLQQMKIDMLAEVYKILVYNLGVPPQKFSYRFIDKNSEAGPIKEYTPISFYKEVLDIETSDYIMFMDDPSREYYKLYEIEFDRNTEEGINWKYINLPAKEIKLMAIESIKNNEAMYFSCDVGKQLERSNGTLDIDNYDYESLYGIPFTMNKKERIITFESGSSHGMTLVAVDLNEKGEPVKWLLENSWGKNNGYQGHLIMTDEWFDEYMFRLVVNKKFVAEKHLNILKQKSTMLPPWDPMFKEDK